MNDLLRRIATGVGVAALAGGAIWFGGLVLGLAIIGCLALLHWEWARLTLPGADGSGLIALTGAACGLGALAVTYAAPGMLGQAPTEELSLAVVGVVAILIYFGVPNIAGDVLARLPRYALWPLWFCPALAAAIWLREVHGPHALLWPVIVVAANDIGAYAAGRTIGGTKLAPRISPSKTWSGFLGGLAAAGVVGALLPTGGAPNTVISAVFVAAAIALASVIGDLAQSAIKRRAGVKDSGALLPGHGGVFDRLDGHLFALPPFAIFVLTMGWPL